MQDIVFASYGGYSKKCEDHFQVLKENHPNVKRIHGLKDESRILSLARDITDTESLQIIFEFNGIVKNIDKKEVSDTDASIIKKFHDDHMDILYLTHKETQAEANFVSLLQRQPNLKRLHGVNGLTRAFRFSAELIDTSYYVLIDGDNKVLDDFNLGAIDLPTHSDTISFYMTQNPVNDLVYGYGGIKICPTINFKNISNDKIDPIVSGGIKKINPIMKVASITEFNTSPFNAWKAGFREGVMFTSPDDQMEMPGEEARDRLMVWKTRGEDRRFGIWAMIGAQMGEVYAKENFGMLSKLSNINDSKWLEAYILTKTGLEQLEELSNVDNSFIRSLKI